MLYWLMIYTVVANNNDFIYDLITFVNNINFFESFITNNKEISSVETLLVLLNKYS